MPSLIFRKGLDLKHAVAGLLADTYHSEIVERIKADDFTYKTGGLTEALALAAEARQRGLILMIGCMVATSLAMAPALLLAQNAQWLDLDGPLLLANDRPDGLVYKDSVVYPARPELWG